METPFRKLKGKQKPSQLPRLGLTASKSLLLTGLCDEAHILILEYSLGEAVLYLCVCM